MKKVKWGKGKIAYVGMLLILAVYVVWNFSQVPEWIFGVNPKKYGDACVYQQSCGNLAAIDCNSAADGPLYYVNKTTKEIVAKCGGFCMAGGCTHCPPKEWTCN